MDRPISILGFGRSGTTWVSDIVSKCLGGLILFEPMFPTVMQDARRYCYIDGSEDKEYGQFVDHLDAVMQGKNHEKWLLRNHVNHPLDEVDDSFLQSIWRECEILGFKEIRANFLLEKIVADLDFNTLFVIRHPCAVIASLKSRPWFWKGDFQGLDNHYRMFTERVFLNPAFSSCFEGMDIGEVVGFQDKIERETAIWAATHKVVLSRLEKLQVPLLFYEDLFSNPFVVARRIFESLGIGSYSFHPAYIFTPSMVTLKTTHDLFFDKSGLAVKGHQMFWKDKLSREEVARVFAVVDLFDIHVYDTNGQPDRKSLAGINVVPGS